jgi:hypothetical protein
MLSLGCGNNQAPTGGNHKKSADTSQKPGEAAAYGLPDMSKEWTPGDYQQFSQYLSKLPPSIMLPHFSSKKSAAIIKKYENHIIMPVFTDKTHDLISRLKIYNLLEDASQKILVTYLNRHESGENYPTELAVIMGTNIAVSAQFLPLLDEFLLPGPSDPNYQKRMEGVKKWNDGTFGIIDAWFTILEETDTYTTDDLIRMSRYVEKYGPPLIKRLDQDQQAKIKERLNKISSQSPIPEIQKIASSLLSKSFAK